jgi:outer membrane protein TolC
MRLKIFLSLVLSTFCAVVQAQQDTATNAPVLLLKDAVDIALDQNFDIRVATVNLKEAKTNNNIGNAGMLPNVSAIGSFNKSLTDAQVHLATGEVQNRHNANSQQLGGAVQLDWILFDGLRMFVNKDRLNQLENVGALTLKSQIQTSVSQVIMSYANVVFQKEQVIALDTAMALASVRMNIAKKNFEVGTSAKTDYLQAQVDYNASKTSSLAQKAMLRQAKDSLMLLLGRDQFASFDVEADFHLDESLNYSEKDEWIHNNFDVQLAEKQKYLAELNVKLARGAQMPILDLNGSYNYNRNQNDAGATLLSRTYGPQVGLNLSLPVFNGLKLQTQKKVAKLEVNRLDLQYQFTQARVAALYRIAWRAYQTAVVVLNLEHENIKFAEENVMIQQARFRVGVSNMLELREAESSYIAALARLVNAGYTVKIAETKMLVLENRLIK